MLGNTASTPIRMISPKHWGNTAEIGHLAVVGQGISYQLLNIWISFYPCWKMTHEPEASVMADSGINHFMALSSYFTVSGRWSTSTSNFYLFIYFFSFDCILIIRSNKKYPIIFYLKGVAVPELKTLNFLLLFLLVM